MLAVVAFVALLVSSKQASAIDLNIQVGGPPPPPVVDYRPWAPPYPGAVWIAGHHEWRDGRWVWIGGYYDYPPRRGAHWVPAHYHDGYYRPGHWAY
jgi:hypothetical protein